MKYNFTPARIDMIEIASRFDEIQATKFDIGAVAFFSREHKKTREWQVLGACQRLLREGEIDFPVYALESEGPDFLTFTAEREVWCPVEVVEVLRPDYERLRFHKEDTARAKPYSFTPPDPLHRPFEPLRKVLSKKSAKTYAPASALVVYFDIGRLSFNNWDIPFHEQLSREHEMEPFECLSAFRRVLIMNSSFKCLIEMHPHFYTIRPDSIS